jgi:multidrug efflux pump
MVISDICIRRPVFATVLSLVITLVGVVAYQRLSVREYPKIDAPVVSVNTDYRGASAEIIESQVTQILEDSLAGIEGIDFITSISRAERSAITVTFRLDRDPDDAASDVRDRVSRVRGRLPDEIEEPVIAKTEADAQPTIYMALSSDRHNELEISDYADRYLKEALQTLPGVAEVRIFGERRYSMRLWVDPMRMAAYGVVPQDVEEALRRQNVEVPGGRIESQRREFTVLSETDLRTPEQFNDLIIKEEKGYLVRLRDVGHAALGPVDERRQVRFTGRNAIAVGVVKQATANPLDISHAVREELPAILDGLPEGMRAEVAYDRSLFIEASIDSVYTTIVEAVVLVIIIIFLFLRSVRAMMIPLVTIPVSLIGACALMFAFGFSLNTLTLLSLVLAIGLVVDDAIVMMENIFRHVEEGMPPLQAAFRGSREIGFAVISMTLTLVAVYVPIGFMTGTTGKLFTEFAWTLAGAVVVSGFVALTLSPMMCAKLLRHQAKHNFLYNVIEGGLRGLTNGYRAILRGALRVRPLVLLIGLAVAGSSWFVFTNLKSELAPYEDQGTILGAGVGPEGATIKYMDDYARRMEELFKAVPEVERYFVVIGFPTVSQMVTFARVKPWDERERTVQQMAQELQPKFAQIPGILAFASTPPPLGQNTRSKPMNFVMMSSGPYQELERILERMLAEIAKNPKFVNVDSDLKLNTPQLKVTVDRDKAADLGIPVQTVGTTLETMFGGRQVTRFKIAGKQYDVMVQVAGVDRNNPQDLSKVYVRGRGGDMVRLSNLVNVEETVAPKELNHFNQMRAATITANLAPGYTLGEALEYIEAAAEEVLPLAVRTDYSGESREFKEASASLYFTFILALLFIYLVLSAQFESFIDPFIIMMTVPLSMTGALLALLLSGHTLNIYSQVGLVTLIGLITKHGILIVEFSNQLRRQGRSMNDAVVEACVLRLRPILMTTGAMVLGAMPLALAHGAGAVSRQAIGWVIVGGLLVGTFFTLFVIPTVYTYLARGKKFAAPAVAHASPPHELPAEEKLQAAE